MKRLAVAGIAALLFLLAFALGLARHFPEQAATRAFESALNASPLLQVTLAPVHLGWSGLRSETLVVRQAAPGSPVLLTLRDVRVPYAFSLWQGAPVRARLGNEGRLSAFLAWNGTAFTLDDLSARLEDLPLPQAPAGMTLQGQATLSGRFTAPARRGPRAELPEGELRGRLENVELKGLQVAGNTLPVTRLQDVELRARTGRTVQIERLEARGDLQGSVQGSLTPNLERFQDSRLSLTVTASARPTWLQETGALRPILEGFFPAGRIDGTLGGTVGVPAWAAKGGR